MRPSQARFVTACQQLLALGAVLAVLAPATGVVSLDVVVREPGAAPQLAAPAAADTRPSLVPVAPVDPVVTEYAVTAPTHARVVATPQASILGRPQPVSGFGAVGAVGVTWSPAEAVSDQDLTVQVRTRDEQGWTAWTDLEYHDDHGPDPGSREALHARPGTEPAVIGDVDEVQVRAESATGDVPSDMRLSVIDPGTPTATREERPAIDTGAAEPTTVTAETKAGTDTLQLQAGTYTPRPQIFSRAQWGANEKLRDPGSLSYYEVHAGFVHHTVNANDYTRDEVPAILRSIYAYHTQSRGWSDIGYNFLVDRFGRIWEGRYGGVDRPVVGAHTLGYNDYAFAMSAIGNFETAQPTTAMLNAYGKLFAWKLSLHGVAADDPSQRVGDTTFPAVNGHRDAASTACPGKNLYAKLSTIRVLAKGYQQSWSGREREVDVLSTDYPDLFLRRASDKAGFVLSTEGLLRFGTARVASAGGWKAKDVIVATPDVTGDGHRDVVARDAATGVTTVHPGDGAGHFGAGTAATGLFAGFDQVTAVSDLNGNGKADLVARHLETGHLYIFSGRGDGTFGRRLLAEGWAGYNLTVGAGDLTGDKVRDVLSRDTAGRLWLHPGTASNALGARRQLAGGWSGFDVLTGFGDYTGDGRNDLVARSKNTGWGYVFPLRSDGTFGHWLGPIGRTEGVASLSSGGDVTGSGPTDLVGRIGDDLVVLPHLGTYDARPPVQIAVSFPEANRLLNVGDWDRDGDGDLITRNGTTGDLQLRLSKGNGTFDAPRMIGNFKGVRQLASVGDMTGDGYPDLMGQPKEGAMRIYPGRGANGLGWSYVAHSAIRGYAHIGVGRWNFDGSPDSLFRVDGKLVLYPGNGPGGLTDPVNLGVDVRAYDWVVGISDASGAGHADLIVREKATGYLWLLPGNSKGVGARRFLAEGLAGYDLVGG